MISNRILEESTPQLQQPMTSQTQQTGFNTTAFIYSDRNAFSFRCIPIGAGGRMLRLPVFPVIRAPAYSKATAVAYALQRIRGDISSQYTTTADIVAIVAKFFCEVSTTAAENEVRLMSINVTELFILL